MRLAKKSPFRRLEKLGEAHPEGEVQLLWAEDEARLGLKPVARRVWAPVGKRPEARFKRGVEVDLPIRLRQARKREGLLDDPAHGEH